MTSGSLLFATGVVHNVFGLALGAPWILEIVADGLVAAIEPDPMRMALFWFLWFGWLLMMIGGLVHGLERRGLVVPAWFGWALLVLAVGGGLAIPASGFWLAVPQAALILFRARQSGIVSAAV